MAAVLDFFVTGTTLTIFNLQVALILPATFCVNWLSVGEKKFKTDFQDGGGCGHLGFPISTILPNLIYKSTRYFLSSNQLAFWFSRRSSK